MMSCQRSLVLALLALLSLFVVRVAAYCECGYTTSSVVNNAAIDFTFVDMIESDFLHDVNITLDSDWTIQNYSVSAAAARGPFGYQLSSDNVILNPYKDLTEWSIHGLNGSDPGVQLIVEGGTPSNGYVVSAQMNTVREDLLYGTFRALIKMPSSQGSCAAFFWYHNDSRELDIEFLTSQVNTSAGASVIQLVDQSPGSSERSYAILGTSYRQPSLNLDVSEAYHEYRIDFLPTQINYYFDSTLIGTLNGSIPNMPGHLVLNHWSNGDKGWTAGPPEHRSAMTVAGVRAYFNSSNPERQFEAVQNCVPGSPGATCQISDWYAHNTSLFTDYFFEQENKTNNQIVYGKVRNWGTATAPEITLMETFLAWLSLWVLAMIFL